MSYTPIVLFVYNRPEHTARTLKSLARSMNAAESELFVFCDGPKSEADELLVSAVRDQLKTVHGHFHRVTIRRKNENTGLARSVISGVSEVLADAKQVIVLEDDLVCAKGFLPFMNSVLNRYEDDTSLFSASGYVFPHTPVPEYRHDAVAVPRSSTWGWATWRDRWEKSDWAMQEARERIDDHSYQQFVNQGGGDVAAMVRQLLEGNIDSWGVPWYLTHLKYNAHAVYPTRNYILNTGLDGSGVNCQLGCVSNLKLHRVPNTLSLPKPLAKDTQLSRNILNFFG